MLKKRIQPLLIEQIVEARKVKKVTQKQMAKHLGLSRTGYMKLEHSAKSISFDQIDTICHVLGVRVALIPDAEFEARNAIKSNPDFWSYALATNSSSLSDAVKKFRESLK